MKTLSIYSINCQFDFNNTAIWAKTRSKADLRVSSLIGYWWDPLCHPSTVIFRLRFRSTIIFLILIDLFNDFIDLHVHLITCSLFLSTSLVCLFSFVFFFFAKCLRHSAPLSLFLTLA